jgi:Flp pilus assembly protein TadD
MLGTRLKLLAVIAVLTAGAGSQNAWARDFRIALPKHSELTPVQRLNREGVDAVRKHDYEKAEAFFYRAYLYDAADPFTLNNLGYISELEGELDRAQKFYALALEQDCNAVIDLSNAKHLEGKPMTYALGGLKDVPMRVNRMNVEAVELLSQDRNFEAADLLQQALTLEPRNPFTINNLGVAKETTGDFEDALKYYDQASGAHSSEPVVVTLQRSWRGKPVSEMASNSARELRLRMRNLDTVQARAALLTFRGVSAINRNDWPGAKRDFLEAYSSDPGSAFSLNNMGYVAEKNGDIETAQFYYSKARQAGDAEARVGLATERSAEGQHLAAVATESHLKVNRELDLYRQAARMQTGPIELIPRGNAPAAMPSAAPNPSSAAPKSN